MLLGSLKPYAPGRCSTLIRVISWRSSLLLPTGVVLYFISISFVCGFYFFSVLLISSLLRFFCCFLFFPTLVSIMFSDRPSLSAFRARWFARSMTRVWLYDDCHCWVVVTWAFEDCENCPLSDCDVQEEPNDRMWLWIGLGSTAFVT